MIVNNIQINSYPTEADIKSASKLGWNVTIGTKDKPYDIYTIPNCVHTIGGRNGINSYYVVDRNIPEDKRTPDCFIPFDGDIQISFEINTRNYLRKGTVYTCTYGYIKIAGEQVYIVQSSKELIMSEINCAIEKLISLPIDIQSIGYEKNIIKRKIWWNNQKAIISDYNKSEGIITIIPDGIEYFLEHRIGTDVDDEMKRRSEINIELLSPSIDWYR